VPLARRLLEKGIPPLSALTYMLAAPVINPVAVLSTYVAFSGNLQMVAGRVFIVAGSAALTGCLCRPGFYAGRPALSNRLDSMLDLNHAHAHGVQHIPADGCNRRMVLDLLSSGGSEFLEMGKYLILGALASAAFKVFLPWQLVQVLAGSTFLSIVVLMLLAVLLCVCSEADAFVAASFVYVPPAAQLGFMALGAMVDLKLIGMYFSAFPQKMAWTLVIVPMVCVFGLAFFSGYLVR
jgi:hypothetical protein